MENISMEVWKGQRLTNAALWKSALVQKHHKRDTTATGIRLFLVFYCLCHSWEMSTWNLFAQSICFSGLMGPAVLFSSENGCRLFTACFNSLLLGSKCISFACGAPLSIRPLCPSSFFKRYFPFLMAGKSISSDLPFPSNVQSEFLNFQLPSTLPEIVYFFP